MIQRTLTFDPICGKRVEPSRSEFVDYKKRKYFFCSAGCKKRFEQRAERMRLHYLAKMGALFGKPKVKWGAA